MQHNDSVAELRDSNTVAGSTRQTIRVEAYKLALMYKILLKVMGATRNLECCDGMFPPPYRSKHH